MNPGQRTNWVLTMVLIVGTFVVLFPLYLTVVLALKTPSELARSATTFPWPPHFENFLEVIRATNYFRALANSFMITAAAAALTLLTNSLVGYAIARNLHRRRFRLMYYYFISAMFIPFPIIMLPLVKETSALGMNNQGGLALLYVIYGLAFNVFLYVAYIRSIPIELDEAAVMDGCSPWGIFWHVIFPLLAPINATVGILTCLWVWNDFLMPLIILGEPEMATLPLIQFVFQNQYDTNYALAFSSYLMAMSPLLIVYVVAQRWIISGITRGAVKG